MLGRPDQVKWSMFVFLVSANAAKLFFKLLTLLTNLFKFVMWAKVNLINLQNGIHFY